MKRLLLLKRLMLQFYHNWMTFSHVQSNIAKLSPITPTTPSSWSRVSCSTLDRPSAIALLLHVLWYTTSLWFNCNQFIWIALFSFSMFLGHWVESLRLIWYFSRESGISEDGSVVIFCAHPSVTNEWTHSCCNNWNFPTTALLCVSMCVRMLEELLFFFSPCCIVFSSSWHHIYEPQSHSHDHSLAFIILLAVRVLWMVACIYIYS